MWAAAAYGDRGWPVQDGPGHQFDTRRRSALELVRPPWIRNRVGVEEGQPATLRGGGAEVPAAALGRALWPRDYAHPGPPGRDLLRSPVARALDDHDLPVGARHLGLERVENPRER